MEIILETIAGKRSVESACEALGLCEAAFYKLRTRTLQEAVEGLEPRPSGRPPNVEPEVNERVSELEAEVKRLRVQLQAARVREELAHAFPAWQKRSKRHKKKDR